MTLATAHHRSHSQIILLFCCAVLVASINSASRRECNCFELSLISIDHRPRKKDVCYSYDVKRASSSNYCMSLDVSSFMLGTGRCALRARDNIFSGYDPSDLVIGYKSKPLNAISFSRNSDIYDSYSLCFASSSVHQLRKTSKIVWDLASSGSVQCDVGNVLPDFCPTARPTLFPTNNPTSSPSDNPTPLPTFNPTPSPTDNPSPSPTDNPTPSPTDNPTPSPTDNPSPSPTDSPTPSPTDNPSPSPTDSPTPSPTDNPTPLPTLNPTLNPSDMPSSAPSMAPTLSCSCGQVCTVDFFQPETFIPIEVTLFDSLVTLQSVYEFPIRGTVVEPDTYFGFLSKDVYTLTVYGWDEHVEDGTVTLTFICVDPASASAHSVATNILSEDGQNPKGPQIVPINAERPEDEYHGQIGSNKHWTPQIEQIAKSNHDAKHWTVVLDWKDVAVLIVTFLISIGLVMALCAYCFRQKKVNQFQQIKMEIDEEDQ